MSSIFNIHLLCLYVWLMTVVLTTSLPSSTPIASQTEEDCRYKALCDPNAVCLSNLLNVYSCYCKPGYFGDGFRCNLAGPVCGPNTKCSSNALCLPVGSSGQLHCVCKEGFTGDGLECVADDKNDCAVLRNCHEHADCVPLPSNITLPVDQLKQPIDPTNSDNSQNKVVSRCVCRHGYTGDGVSSCDPIKDHCSQDEDCGLHGLCLSDHQTRSNIGNSFTNLLTHDHHQVHDSPVVGRRCGCIENYYWHPQQGCIAEDQVTCDLVPNCHEKATCKFNIKKHRFECDCGEKYRGDGKHCEPILQTCDILKNCDPKADCVYNHRIREHQCVCQSGFVGDGYNCRPSTSCNFNSTLCDTNAECVFSTQMREHQCICKGGYLGNGYQCAPVARHGPQHLIFSQGKSLLNVALEKNDNSNRFNRLVYMNSHHTPISLDVDCVDGYVYWTDITSKAIHRAPYNASIYETVLQSSSVYPEGIAIDWLSRNIYWTDPVRDVIEVMRIDGTDHKILINNDLVNPRGIAVHPGLGKLYWSDWNRADPKIEQANLDSSGRQVLVSGNLALPNMLTIDYANNDLCWTDAGMHRIECIKLNGQNRRIIYTPAKYPFGLAVAGQYIYWTDWQTHKLSKVHRNGGNSELVSIPEGGHGKLYGIVLAPTQCPQMSNACAVQNGLCKHLCLPTGEGSRICVCPDSVETEDECQAT